MALRCGTTVNGCNGKVGMYRIDFVIPNPAYVRYRYEGENWQEVKKPDRNLDYRLEKTSQPGQGQGVRYRISAWTKADLYFDSPGTTNDRFDGTQYPHYGLPWNSADFLGPITSVRFRPGEDVGVGRNIIRIQIIHANGTFQASCRYFRGPDASGGETSGGSLSHYWKRPVPPPDHPLLGVRFVRVSGLPETDRWQLRVIDSMNNVVFTRESDTKPEAVVIPEAYGNNKGNFNISNRNENKFLKIVRATENDRKVTNVFLGDTLVQKLTSPIGATLYPKVCWDCTEGDKCPKGSCEVKCKNHICCVNQYGRVVKTIKK